MTGESIVAGVVGGYGHDGSGAIAGQHVVAHPDGYLLACHGVDGVGAGEDAADLLVDLALALGLVADFAQVCLHGLVLLRGGDLGHIVGLGGKNHEGDAKDGVGACGEDFELEVVAARQGEEHLGAFAATNPVALGLLEAIAPFQSVEAVKQTLCVCGDAEAPLAHLLLLHGESAADTESLADLVVGQHGAELGTPVDHGLGLEGEAVVHQHLGAAHGVHGFPLVGGEAQFLAGGGVQALGAVGGEMGLELCYRPGLLGLGVVPGAEHPHERPLRPFII